MKNAVYPTLSSQFYNFGNNNNNVHQMLNSDVSLFFHESQLTNDQLLGSFAPLSTIEIPPSINYLNLSGLLTTCDASTCNTTTTTTTTVCDNNTSSQQPLFTENPFPVQKYSELNDRKRPNETGEKFTPYSTFVNESNTKKKKTAESDINVENRHPKYLYFLEKQRLELETTQDQNHQTLAQKQMPVKRSQKIGDKITTLQKLVSPFGKTDTASVLKEASAHIKVLHNQIQMLTNPYFRPGPLLNLHHLQGDTGERNYNDLRRRGLCLVPVSFTQNIIKEDRPEHSHLVRTNSIFIPRIS